MVAWSAQLDKPTILVGDFNVAPLECDVWSNKQLLNVVSHTPIDCELLARLQAANDWVDLGGKFVPAPQRISKWWSYPASARSVSDRGRRLDHTVGTPAHRTTRR